MKRKWKRSHSGHTVPVIWSPDALMGRVAYDDTPPAMEDHWRVWCPLPPPLPLSEWPIMVDREWDVSPDSVYDVKHKRFHGRDA